MAALRRRRDPADRRHAAIPASAVRAGDGVGDRRHLAQHAHRMGRPAVARARWPSPASEPSWPPRLNTGLYWDSASATPVSTRPGSRRCRSGGLDRSGRPRHGVACRSPRRRRAAGPGPAPGREHLRLRLRARPVPVPPADAHPRPASSAPFRRTDLFGIDLSSQRSIYYVCLVVLAVLLVLVGRLRRSPVGWSTMAVRDNPDAAAAYTVNPTMVKLRAFALAGGTAGLAGGLLASVTQSISLPVDRYFTLNDSLTLLAIVVIGGLGSTTGPVVGAMWVIGLPFFFPGNSIAPLLTSSVGLLVLLLYFPGGFAQVGYGSRDVIWRGSRAVSARHPRNTYRPSRRRWRSRDRRGRQPMVRYWRLAMSRSGSEATSPSTAPASRCAMARSSGSSAPTVPASRP